MGITHHAHGVQNVQAIANLALLRGMVGRPGCGPAADPRPLERARHRLGRRHAQAQGRDLRPAAEPLRRRAADDARPRHDGLHRRRRSGRAESRLLPRRQSLRLEPRRHLRRRRRSASSIMLVYLSTTLNTGHAHGLARETIILPVLARDEEPQPTTQESMFNYVRLSDGGPRAARRPAERSRGDRVDRRTVSAERSDRARRVAIRSPIDWPSMRSTAQIRQAIAAHRARLREARRDRPHASRNSRSPAARSTSRGSPRPTAAPACTSTSCPLCRAPAPANSALMTIRSEGQFNTVVYEDYDVYRGIDRRDVILLHPDDLARFGLERRRPRHRPRPRRQRCTASAPPRSPTIKPGNAAMYYPEAQRARQPPRSTRRARRRRSSA